MSNTITKSVHPYSNILPQVQKSGLMCGEQTHRVTRYGVSTTNDVTGVVSSGPPVMFDIRGSLQPLTPREQVLLPEGERTRQRAHLFSTTRLITTHESLDRVADRLTDEGGSCWEVEGVEDWSIHAIGCPHFKYTLAHVGRDELGTE